MHLPAILGEWGPPPDRPAWGALVAAALALGVAYAPADVARRMARAASSRAALGVAAFAAALLSLGYVAFYLRGGPRIVDATSYFLQARALSEGHFAWHVPEPTASFRGRFLLLHDGEIAGIFPPGYPLLLSLGFAVGAPLVVGPALAAGIVVATWLLARELGREIGMGARGEEAVARIAACLSVACGALRYHTADTMAHGACALAFALALVAGLRARREGLPWFFLLAGLALGFVIATRFASALALGSVVGWLAFGARGRNERRTALAACAIGALPGVLLLLVAESAATGHALGSAQTAYYATSDGPPGCFRYGFGAGIGCLVEHGEFVRARASGGVSSYGLLSALGVTLRRLRMHSEDVANFEPLALLMFAPLLRARSRTLGVRTCLALVGAIVAAYAPFYFDGDYPGGGARFFADVLPVEHALVAVSLAGLGGPASLTRSLRASGGLVLALALAGFAVHAAYDHEQLRTRDGGHPMFDPEIFAERSLGAAPKDGSPTPASLVFFETDHGFALAHDADTADRAAEALARGEKPAGVVVAHLRSDDHDRLLYERLGHPPTWVYRFVPDSPKTMARAAAMGHEVASGNLEPWIPSGGWTGGAETWRFETENEWPPLAQTGNAWAEPIWATDTCASPSGSGRALAIHASGPGDGTVVVALPIPRAGAWRVTPRLLVDGGAHGVAIEVRGPGGEVLARWEPVETDSDFGGAGRTCIDVPSRVLSVESDRELRLSITAPHDATHLVALDRLLLSPSPR